MILLVNFICYMKYYISKIYWDINMEMVVLNNISKSFKLVVGIRILYEEN